MPPKPKSQASGGLAALARAARASAAASSAASADPLSGMDWLPHQLAYLQSAQGNRWRLLRTGNRLGKTTVAAAETVLYALGRHPYDPRPPLKEQWCITVSWSQSLAVQKALWDLVPKDELAPGQTYDFRRGFGAANPSLLFRNGSVVRIKTTQQGSLNLAGHQIARIWFDEPPTDDVWDECVARTRTAGGLIAVSLTPIGRDCTFLKELVDAEKLADIHSEMTPEAFVHTRSGRIYRTDDGRPCDAAWIAEQEELCLPHTVPVRLHGLWETRAIDRVFESFDAGKHVSKAMPLRVDMDLYLGVDHGANLSKTKQAAVLCGVVKSAGDAHAKVYVLDEWQPIAPGVTTPEDDATAILAMLGRFDWKWGDLDGVHGDNPTSSGGGVSKGNVDLEAALAKRMNIRPTALKPRVQSAKRGKRRGRGAVEAGVKWLHHQFTRGNIIISPRCQNLITALEKWDGTSSSVHKDIIDALRYALIPLIFARPSVGSTTIRNW